MWRNSSLNDPLAVEEIDVIDHQHINSTEALTKAGERTAHQLQRLGEMIGEPLRRKEVEPATRRWRVRSWRYVASKRWVFPGPHAAVKHQRIVSASRLIADLQRAAVIANSLPRGPLIKSARSAKRRPAGTAKDQVAWVQAAECGFPQPMAKFELTSLVELRGRGEPANWDDISEEPRSAWE